MTIELRSCLLVLLLVAGSGCVEDYSEAAAVAMDWEPSLECQAHPCVELYPSSVVECCIEVEGAESVLLESEFAQLGLEDALTDRAGICISQQYRVPSGGEVCAARQIDFAGVGVWEVAQIGEPVCVDGAGYYDSYLFFIDAVSGGFVVDGHRHVDLVSCDD